MNYFVHGIRFLDRPYYLIGSAIPDLLSVVDRRSRVRRRAIEQRLPTLIGEDRELALGIMQHLADDQWFHGTEGFYAVTGTLGEMFRAELGPDDDWHCGFLGHIVTELLMDSTFMEDHPESLNAYYAAFSKVDPMQVQTTVSALATRPVMDLAKLIELFIHERFLADYVSDERLLYRLNQVMRRVGLKILPENILGVLQQCRLLVRRHMHDLLPPAYFSAVGMPENSPRILG